MKANLKHSASILEILVWLEILLKLFLFAGCGMTRSSSLVRTTEVYLVLEGLTGHFVVQNTLFGREGLEGPDLSMVIYWNEEV